MLNMTSKVGLATNGLRNLKYAPGLNIEPARFDMTSNVMTSKCSRSRKVAPLTHLSSGMTSDQGVRARRTYDLESQVTSLDVSSSKDDGKPGKLRPWRTYDNHFEYICDVYKKCNPHLLLYIP